MERLILFAKYPRPGRVKTRLVPPLTPAQACALYRAFLQDQLAFVGSLATSRRQVELCLDEPGELPGALRDLATRMRRSLQQGADLGERMRRAVERALAEGAQAVVIVGADAPTLPRNRVLAAFRRLREGADAVVVPAADGGYVLVGVRGACGVLFEGIGWGGEGVLAATRLRARQAGLDLHELGPWYDVDVPEDFRRLRRSLRLHPQRAPATSRAFANLALPREGVL